LNKLFSGKIMNEVLSETWEVLSEKYQKKIENMGIRINPAQFDFIFGYPPITTLKKSDLDYHFLKTNKDIGIYIHIPFCDNLCSYCYFHKSIFNDVYVDLYVNNIIKEITLYSEVFDQKKEIKYIYFGGGSPSLLSIKQIEKILLELNLSFLLAADIEITFEGSPNNFSDEKIKFLKNNGVTRISIGVQTFNENVLKSMNRNEHSQKIVTTINNILLYFPETFNVDLIYGYPGMDKDTVSCDLIKCINLNIPSITTYQLWTRIKNNLYNNNHLREEELFIQKLIIADILQENGYYRDKSDWFLKTTKSKYNFQNHKWNNGYYLGIGCSSYAYINEFYYRNIIDINEYMNKIGENQLGIKYSIKLSKEDQIRRYCALSIKTREGINLEKLQDSYYYDNYIVNIIENLADNGLVCIPAKTATHSGGKFTT